jgi:signal peptidase
MTMFVQTVNLTARVLLAITVISLLAGAAGLMILHSRGERLLSIQTGSMVPTFRPGDALIVGPVMANQLRVGDIISYRSPRNASITISHRLIAVNRQTGWLTTAGDALHSPDPPFSPTLVLGRATALAPRLGTVLDVLRRPIGLALAVYLPALVIMVAEIRRLIRCYSLPTYRLGISTRC